MSTVTQVCNECSEVKPIEAFGSVNGKRRATCNLCRNLAIQVHRYGISVEDFRAMYASQGGCCAICSSPEVEFKMKLSIDHNHQTGKVRGLLCTNCNQGLGKFRESRERLQAAIRYLEVHQ